jgi:hypothetical protein
VFVGEPKLAKNTIFSDIQGILDPRQTQSLLPRFACKVRSKPVSKWPSSNEFIIALSAQAIEKITHMRVGVESSEMARTRLLSENSEPPAVSTQVPLVRIESKIIYVPKMIQT